MQWSYCSLALSYQCQHISYGSYSFLQIHFNPASESNMKNMVNFTMWIHMNHIPRTKQSQQYLAHNLWDILYISCVFCCERLLIFPSISMSLWEKVSEVTPLNNGPFNIVQTLIPAWISNHIHYKTCDEITYPFPNFNGCTIEVWKWISHFIPHFTGHVITYPCED